MRKIQFTFSDHVQLATDLDGMRTIAILHLKRLSEAYPKTSRQVRQAIKIQKAIDSLRCEMDNVFCREYPGAQFRRPYYDWVHTPYFNPERVKKINPPGSEQKDE
ncbi:MAG: hypothetical protein JXA82_05705 [Sedimentisphaerales bacterium]|nr:hypothetical protein [Sedimentisphaerales bacterium]